MSESEFTPITEGQATVLFSKTEAEAFYNPVQELNRDLSISVISSYLLSQKEEHEKTQKEYHPVVVEALAASGLRSIRYAKELPQEVDFKVISNDISKTAVEAINRNAKYNNATRIIPSESDAVLMLYKLSQEKNKADVIDLDPYGAPTQFLDASFAAIRDNGLMAVTCTDMACLAGTHVPACYSKYGAMPWHSSCGHEFGLRLALQALAETASRHKKYIVPLVCFHIDFYVRMFIIVKSSVSLSGELPLHEGLVFTCLSCESFCCNKLGYDKDGKMKASPLRITSNICEHCKSPLHINGPVWMDDYIDYDFTRKLLKRYQENEGLHVNSRRRIMALLQLLSDELPNTPLFYALDRAAHFFKLSVPPRSIFVQALESKGFKTSFSHTYPNSIKTNADAVTVWDLFREFNSQNPSKVSEQTPAYVLLKEKQKTVFELTQFKKIKEKKPNPLFVEKPGKNWGPGCKKKKTLTNKINSMGEDKKEKEKDEDLDI
ncbi:hypothetical protein EIN_226780 [Entamoeba invadens IP1]|uniref:tRNA (guanine(26)-N(2))-dimethyltransferase n=1 Tax=Entamoeba invadens IP1 TaxID=370355 RepID=A0A0A1U5Z2_ENTIV|nr:hypothetical protein EIN_226780 [Entamoeba invadens IP1]ELP88295.1 hypothetical protein EIN_226780 [Entamoeba invadens IP1]|eukprot:XP_004255066.1 hypothetical protein EIN_226780 [Entamoeba invadens IP1]